MLIRTCAIVIIHLQAMLTSTVFCRDFLKALWSGCMVFSVSSIFMLNSSFNLLQGLKSLSLCSVMEIFQNMYCLGWERVL